jgi:hypothetical protein
MKKNACSKGNMEKKNTNTLCWAFYCVNDGRDVESENL